MNLHDFVKRKDRDFFVEAGHCEAEILNMEDGPRRCLRLSDGARIVLKNAHVFHVFRLRKNNYNWSVLIEPNWKSVFNRSARFTVSARQNGKSVVLSEVKMGGSSKLNVEFKWPHIHSEFDIVIETEGSLILDIGANASARSNLLKLAKGFGIEVGPGLNPAIRPSPNVQVEYIEAMPISTWGEVYKLKPENFSELEAKGLLQLYRLGQASTVEELYPPEALDFIFSSHVIEHLVNPLRIFEIWSSRLRKNGKVLGVIPDFRYCFDLRQSPSQDSDFEREYAKGGFDLEEKHYIRWIQLTSPSSSLESLKTRNYSVHVHNYSPEVFLRFADCLIEKGLYSEIHMETFANNKDFGFILVK